MIDHHEDDGAANIRMIRDSVAAIAPATAGFRRVRELRFTPLGYDPSIFRQMGELGWIGLLLSEEQGGSGLGMQESCALCEELGAGLVPEPLISAMTSAAVVASAGCSDLLADIVAGRVYSPVAWQESADTLAVSGTVDADRLFVPAAAGADGFLVPVRRDARLQLLLCRPDSLILSTAATQDGGHYGAVRPGAPFEDGTPLSEDVAYVLLEALDRAALGTAAYLLGVMEAAFALTLDYIRTRTQFGRPIGSFQALQHRAADLRIQVALTRASVESAAEILDLATPSAERRAAVSRAKARSADASLLVTRQAIQLHGAVGYTDECDVGLFLRKAMVLANQYGSAGLHRKRFMADAPNRDDGIAAVSP